MKIMSRNHRLYLRLNNAELEVITACANEMNMSPARYSRERAIGTLRARTDDLTRRQLVAVGNNLNQISRHLNARRGRVAEIADDLVETLAKLRAQVAALDKSDHDDHSED
jgi:hypothetical protein